MVVWLADSRRGLGNRRSVQLSYRGLLRRIQPPFAGSFKLALAAKVLIVKPRLLGQSPRPIPLRPHRLEA